MFAKIVFGLIILILLSGCFQSSKPTILSTPASTTSPLPNTSPAQPSAKDTKGYLRPDVDEKQPAVSDKDPITFRFLSDLNLDRATLEKAIKEQMISNIPDRKDFNYIMNWQSDKAFTLTFQDLLPRETIHVSTLHTKTKEPGTLNEETPHLYEIVFQHREANTPPAIVMTNFNDLNQRYIESNTMEPIQLLRQTGSGDVFFMTYDHKNFKLFGGNNDSSISIPIPIAKEENELAKLHGYRKFLFSDTYYGDFTYVVMSHSMVYRVNTLTGGNTLIYTSPLPILGISSSPNGKSIGLTVAQDHDLRTETDLLVINEKGKVTLTMPKTSFLSHSDGYLTLYPLEWVDDHKLHVTTEFPNEPKLGKNEIDLTTKSIVKIHDTTDDFDIVKKITEQEREMRAYFSPDQSKFVYATRSNANFYNELWMTETDKNTSRFVGIGHFLGWTSANTFAWVEYDSEGSVQP